MSTASEIVSSPQLAYVRPLSVPTCLDLPSLSDKKYTLLHFVKDYLLGVIQYIFKKCLSEFKLHTAEQLSANHMNLYAEKFNRNRNSHAVMLSSSFSVIEANGGKVLDENGTVKDSWNIPYKEGQKNYFERLIDNFKQENPKLLEIATEKLDKPQENLSLREILTANDKHVLALPINVESSHFRGLIKGRHWTVIHLNFQTNIISYLDSIKPNRQAAKVQERLMQILEWISNTDTAHWILDKKEDEPPSILSDCKQWDFFNCGVFAIQFSALAGEGKTYQEINDIPFSEMYQQIEARRSDVINCVRGFKTGE